jgi:hypothetical protein
LNCAAFEQLIALFVEGDLRDADHVRVEAHIRGCVACRNLADELRESLGLIKDLRHDAIQMSALVTVRQRVLNEVGDLDPAPGWVVGMHRLFFAGLRRRNAIAGIVLAAVISGGVWYSQKTTVREITSEAPAAVANLNVPAELVSPVRIAPRPVVLRVVKPAALPEILPEIPSDNFAELAAPEPVQPQVQVSQLPTMKFVTDDPNIIIYWLPSDKGD